MILLADVGNSRIKWAVWDGSGFRQRGQASHGAENWTEWAERQWRELPTPSRVLMVSVAGPEARSAFTDWIQKIWGIEAQFVGVHDGGLRGAQRLCANRNGWARIAGWR